MSCPSWWPFLCTMWIEKPHPVTWVGPALLFLLSSLLSTLDWSWPALTWAGQPLYIWGSQALFCDPEATIFQVAIGIEGEDPLKHLPPCLVHNRCGNGFKIK